MYLLSFGLVLHSFRIETEFFADIPQKVDNIHRALCFAYSYFHSVPRVFVRNSAISSSNSCMNVIIFSLLVN